MGSLYKKVVFSGVSAGVMVVGGVGLSYATGSSHAPVTPINQAIEQIAQQHTLTQTNNAATHLDSFLSKEDFEQVQRAIGREAPPRQNPQKLYYAYAHLHPAVGSFTTATAYPVHYPVHPVYYVIGNHNS